MKKLQNYLLLAIMLFGNAIAALASNYGDVFKNTRSDFRDESIYFVMTTRFFDGDESNNTQCWDNQSANQNDPPWRGDFKGLIERLDYIKALGFTAVWITPIVENASGYDYHGYHAHDFSKVDHRYESEGVGFQELINAAHAKGMKIILDIVLNHTGNFGETNLCKLFTRDTDPTKQADINACMIPYTKKDGGKLPDNYLSIKPGAQYDSRLTQMKNTLGQNNDVNNYWHHYAHFNWDNHTRWHGQIAGDCVDLNTENPAVTNYLVECYGKFIAMGVDGFRIDTSGHISRLTFNKAFLPQFTDLANKHKAKRNGGPFFMYGEVCARERNVTYRNTQYASPYFYTWKETKDYAWDTSETSWNNIVVKEGELGNHTNMSSVEKSATDYAGESNLPNSNNAFLKGNEYHTPDYSKWNNFSVIDFPMHWNFRTAQEAFGVKYGDKYYNDATYNVVYVDSHDYAPDGAPESVRFNQDEDVWAENASLMFTFRGIPCIYYGSEIQFKKGAPIDKGPEGPLSATGRAYYGGYITGDINVTDFADYSASGNANATLNHPLALHFQRLNQIRMAVPALRKGQYSTDGCNGTFAFKRRYKDATTDSYCLVTISGGATFSNILNGTYIDVVTGDVKTVSDGKLTATCSGKGNLRVYVLQTDKNSVSGKVGKDGKYIYGPKSVVNTQPSYDGKQEEGSANNGGSAGSQEPEIAIDPCVAPGEKCIFFQKPANWGGIVNCYIWDAKGNKPMGEWPGSAMVNLGADNYKITFNGDYSGYNFIFNDGSGNQTSDLSDLKLSAMYNSSGTVVKTIAEGDCEAGEGAGSETGGGNEGGNTGGSVEPEQPSVTPEEQTVFFEKPEGWGTTYCYVWYGDGAGEPNGAWPGKACTDLGNGLCKFTFDTTIGQPSEWGIIFNYGSLQTDDFVAENRKIYSMSGVKGEANVEDDNDDSGTVSVEDVEDTDNIEVYAMERTIFVINTEDRMITVRSLDGRVLYNGTNPIIPVQSAGIYLVSIEGA
ncbi:MAG: starch-binding protein, partial [Paludibacteraceae bacterium]|nr:starch-binding protein [Paludibacteraceae bacterium]